MIPTKTLFMLMLSFVDNPAVLAAPPAPQSEQPNVRGGAIVPNSSSALFTPIREPLAASGGAEIFNMEDVEKGVFGEFKSSYSDDFDQYSRDFLEPENEESENELDVRGRIDSVITEMPPNYFGRHLQQKPRASTPERHNIRDIIIEACKNAKVKKPTELANTYLQVFPMRLTDPGAFNDTLFDVAQWASDIKSTPGYEMISNHLDKLELFQRTIQSGPDNNYVTLGQAIENDLKDPEYLSSLIVFSLVNEEEMKDTVRRMTIWTISANSTLDPEDSDKFGGVSYLRLIGSQKFVFYRKEFLRVVTFFAAEFDTTHAPEMLNFFTKHRMRGVWGPTRSELVTILQEHPNNLRPPKELTENELSPKLMQEVIIAMGLPDAIKDTKKFINRVIASRADNKELEENLIEDKTITKDYIKELLLKGDNTLSSLIKSWTTETLQLVKEAFDGILLDGQSALEQYAKLRTTVMQTRAKLNTADEAARISPPATQPKPQSRMKRVLSNSRIGSFFRRRSSVDSKDAEPTRELFPAIGSEQVKTLDDVIETALGIIELFNKKHHPKQEPLPEAYKVAAFKIGRIQSLRSLFLDTLDPLKVRSLLSQLMQKSRMNPTLAEYTGEILYAAYLLTLQKLSLLETGNITDDHFPVLEKTINSVYSLLKSPKNLRGRTLSGDSLASNERPVKELGAFSDDEEDGLEDFSKMDFEDDEDFKMGFDDEKEAKTDSEESVTATRK